MSKKPKPPKLKIKHMRTVLSKRKKQTFLKTLAKTGRVIHSSQVAGYKSPSPLYEYRKTDPEFAAAWDEAMDQAADILEEEAQRRAVDGVMKPQRYKGKVVGYDIQYSDALLMFLLKGARPDKFADRKKVEGEINGNFGMAVLPMTAPDMDEWERKAIEMHQAQSLLPDPSKTADERVIEGEVIDVTPKSKVERG